jgi:hypothetical protein
MTLQQFERARLAQFAHEEAAHTGSLDAMRAICYIMRNRAKAGWYEGTILSVIEAAHESAGNEGQYERVPIQAGDRNFQLLLHHIEDIYHGTAQDPVRDTVGDCLYYTFANRTERGWFVDNVIRDAGNHPRRASFGLMFLFA